MTFEPTQTLLHTTVVVQQDDSPEDTETFTVILTNPLSGADIGPRGAVTVNILSNDNAHGIIQFAAVCASCSLFLFALHVYGNFLNKKEEA